MVVMFDAYHQWYVSNLIHDRTTFAGVPVVKHVGDLWNYQEVIYQMRPSLIVEMGTWHGGGALYFAEMAKLMRLECRILAVDPDHSRVTEKVRQHPQIELLTARSVDSVVAERIQQMRQAAPGPMLVSLDSDHMKANVLLELSFLRPLTRTGDYLVVEDGNINGHPVLPNWGEGPYEALAEYMALHPNDYERDTERENKFGVTYAPMGYLRRR